MQAYWLQWSPHRWWPWVISVCACSLRTYTQDTYTQDLICAFFPFLFPFPCVTSVAFCCSHVIVNILPSLCKSLFNWWLFLSCSLIAMLHLSYLGVKILIIELSLFCDTKVVQLFLSQFGADVGVSWVTTYWLLCEKNLLVEGNFIILIFPLNYSIPMRNINFKYNISFIYIHGRTLFFKRLTKMSYL